MPDDKEVSLCADLIVRSLFHCLGGARSERRRERAAVNIHYGGTQRSYVNVNRGWAGDGVPAWGIKPHWASNKWLGYVSGSSFTENERRKKKKENHKYIPKSFIEMATAVA